MHVHYQDDSQDKILQLPRDNCYNSLKGIQSATSNIHGIVQKMATGLNLPMICYSNITTKRATLYESSTNTLLVRRDQKLKLSLMSDVYPKITEGTRLPNTSILSFPCLLQKTQTLYI